MTAPATLTRKKVSAIFERLALDYEKLTGARLTIDIIHSPKWRELQKAYREIWLPLMAEKEVEK
jgi:hypothetical protein